MALRPVVLNLFFGSLCLLFTQVNHAAIPEPEKLIKGRYLAIIEDKSLEGTGQWAFARFFIAADKATYEAALASHKKDDLLGSFIVMKCHDDGIGVRRDPAVKWRMNVLLREKLAAIKNPNAIESYILANLSQADAEGVIDVSKFKNQENAYKIAGKNSSEYLADSARKGFAQAMVEVGSSYQKTEPAKALEFFLKAARSGLAGGMKDVGFFYAQGIGTEQDSEKAYQWTRKAADLGDIYATLNMSAFFQRLQLPGSSVEEARKYVEKAAHPIGKVEKAINVWKGINGYEKNREESQDLLQEAARSGSGFLLGQIAYFFTDGDLGVPKNYRKAIEFGKAAWVQGNENVARTIAHSYKSLKNPTELDKKNEKYWNLQAMGGGLAFALGEDKNPRVLKELDAIDPFALKIR